MNCADFRDYVTIQEIGKEVLAHPRGKELTSLTPPTGALFVTKQKSRSSAGFLF